MKYAINKDRLGFLGVQWLRLRTSTSGHWGSIPGQGTKIPPIDSEQKCLLFQQLSRVQLFATPWTVATRLLCPQDSSDKNTGVGCHFLLQGIFPTQGLNLSLLCLLHWQSGSLLGKPQINYTSIKKEDEVEESTFSAVFVTSRQRLLAFLAYGFFLCHLVLWSHFLLLTLIQSLLLGAL